MAAETGRREPEIASSLRRAAIGSLALGVAVLPFNDLPYLRSLLGEMGVEGFVYPTLCAMLLWGGALVRERRPPAMPRAASLVALGVFLGWVIVSSTANSPDILTATFKGRSGIEKNLRQTAVLAYMALIPFVIYDLLHRYERPIARVLGPPVGLSVAVVSTYAVFEGLSVAHEGFGQALEGLDRFLRPEPLPPVRFRVRSVTGEPSYLALYVAVAFPAVLTFVFTARERVGVVAWYAALGCLWTITLLSYSRTGYVVVLAELLIYLAVVSTSGLIRARRGTASRAVTAILLLALVSGLAAQPQRGSYSIVAVADTLLPGMPKISRRLPPGTASPFEASDDVRGLSQAFALEIAIDNRFLGVGLGQYAFHLPASARERAWSLSTEEGRRQAGLLVEDRPGTPWPPVYSLYLRLLAETGVPGLLLWVAIWVSAGLQTFAAVRASTGRADAERRLTAAAVCAAVVGVSLVGFAHDSFRYPGYWLVLGLASLYTGRWLSHAPAPEETSRA